VSKLEFKSKSLDYDPTNNKQTHIILVDDNNSVVHVFLEESAIDLSNAELYKMAMQKHYDINFPSKAENEKFDKVDEKLGSMNDAMDVLVAFAVSMQGNMGIPAYRKIASVAKPLELNKRYANMDVITAPYPYNTNEKWPKDTPTLFTFSMQEGEGYNYKGQKVEELLRQGVLNMVLPRVD
jgi:hypothetical protein